MKIILSTRNLKRSTAYTLLEIMMSTGVMSIALMAFLFSATQGGKVAELVGGKLSYTLDSQFFLSKIVPNIREAKNVEVGLWSAGTFTPITDNSYRLAHAIRVFTTTNQANYTIYYLDPADETLRRHNSGDLSSTRLIGTVTNTTPFSKEDFAGNLLTNDPSVYVLGIHLEMKDVVFGELMGDGTSQFDNFRLSTKVTRRMAE